MQVTVLVGGVGGARFLQGVKAAAGPGDTVRAVVNVGDLEQFDANSTVDMAALKSKRLVVGTFDGVRVLGEGDLKKPLTVKADHFSKSAAEKIAKAGGKTETLPKPKKPVRNKMGTRKKALEAKYGPKKPKA